MKKIKLYITFLFSIFLLFSGCTTEKEAMEKHHFDNKIYINVAKTSDEVLFNHLTGTVTRELSVSTALKVDNPVTGSFAKDTLLLSDYRLQHNDPEAIPLPDSMCVLINPDITIETGSVSSPQVTVEFVGIDSLDREKTYVMPIVLRDIKGLESVYSKTVVYYIFKGASLINVVADISNNNFPVNWKSDVSDLKTITVEALINVNDFGTAGGVKGEAISSIFGIEGSFLIRIGDANFPQNQVQLVNRNGNFPSGNTELGLPTGKWVHIAVVWDGVTGDRIIYTNGKEVAHDMNASGSLNLTNNCYVGKSYNDSRWLNGSISELRIWSVQRTAQELSDNMYYIDPSAQGLIAYWKFDEGAGDVVKDQTINGNDITSANNLSWKAVSLP